MEHGVILVRHAEVENPANLVYADLPGFRLSTRGRRQAADTADRLAGERIVAVYSSPLERAIETAASIAAAHGLPIRTDGQLVEWRLSDRWKGVPWHELDVHFPGEVAAYLERPWDLAFNPEPLDALAARMDAAVRAIAAAHPEGWSVVVSHQDPVQAARLTLRGVSLRALSTDKPRHSEAFALAVGDPWVEQWRYAPAEQEGFPPGS